jgi:hypothetical protein
MTFKSHQEKLSAWTLLELLGHHVNLRKQVSPSMDEDDLLPEEDFRLYAVCARYPQQLLSLNIPLRSVGEGVYEVEVLTRRIRIIVANQLPQQEHNAMLHLFSTRPELLAYGFQHYRIQSSESSTLLLQLYQRYKQEGQIMPDALEQFARETIERLLKELPPEKRLEGLSLEQRLQGLSPAELRELAEKLKANGASTKPE